MEIKRSSVLSFAILFFWAAGCLPLRASGPLQGPPVNRNALLIQDFENRVAQYVKLHKQMEAALPSLKPGGAAKVADHQRMLADKLRAARRRVKQGDIFTPEISTEFRRLIRTAMHGARAARIQTSLRHAEPVKLRLYVNEAYPQAIPLQSMPPTLLLNLPKLPPQLEYRIAGRDLVLRDVGSNLVVDLIRNAIP
ncbi:MAG: hypothetical protein ACRD18_03185 [Terriglobia bacterium]